MGGCISLGRIFKSGGDTALSDFSRVARTLSAIQVILGVVDLVLYFVDADIYHVWYWIVTTALSFTLALCGFILAFRTNIRALLLFTIVFWVRYGWYFFTEYMLAYHDKREKIDTQERVLFVLRLVYGVVYLFFMIFFWRKMLKEDAESPELRDPLLRNTEEAIN